MTFVRWSFPTEVLFGVGAASESGASVRSSGGSRVLVVTDAGVRRAGLIEPVLESLAAAGLPATVFDKVEGNPHERHVNLGFEAYQSHGADAIVAVGGGSVIDVAKIVALREHHRRPLGDYDDAIGGDRLVVNLVAPIIAIPTTAGTGSEVGRSGVITLAATGRKTVLFSPRLMPRVALLDPNMTRSMPAFITAATGYDALTHCVEAFVSRGDHPLCDGIALGGIALVTRSLRRAVEDGDDIEARGDMLKAAMMGAVAFQKGLGACHSLAHPLSNLCGTHHGLANALCLPAVVQFNLGPGGDVGARYAEILRILTGTEAAARASGEASARAAMGCADALAELRRAVGLPESLSAAGVAESQLEALAEGAIADSCHASNPRACTLADMRALYRASF